MRGDTPQASSGTGTLACYAPWGDVVMFYDDFSAAADGGSRPAENIVLE